MHNKIGKIYGLGMAEQKTSEEKQISLRTFISAPSENSFS
jgi:hypothetical protein